MMLRALALLCLLSMPPLKAQAAGVFPVRRYGTEQGLGSEVVSSMVQDHEGQLWVGTEGGLSTFDGRQFLPYSGALAPGFILNLSVDLDGAVWVSTDGGLTRISHGRSRIFTEADGIPQGAVQEVARDAEGHLWALTSQGIRVEHAPKGFTVPTPWPGQELPAHLFADPSLSGAWAITSRTIWHWQENHWEPLASPQFAPGEILLDIAVDGDRDLWVRTSSSLWRLPGGEGSGWIGRRMAGGYSHISRLSRDRQGWVWVDAAEGLSRVRGDRREPFGHAQDDARGGIVDQEGGFWLRTDKGVLRILGQTRWRSYGPQDGLPLDTTWQMLRDHQNRLWVAMDAGLWMLDGARFQRVLPGRFLTLALAEDGTLWATGSPGGTVHTVDTKTLATKALRIEPLPVARISAGVAVDADGLPWVVNEQGHPVRGMRDGRNWMWTPMPTPGAALRGVRSLMALPGGGILMLHDQSASFWHSGAWHPVPDLLPDLPWVAAVDATGKLVIAYKNRSALTVHRLKNGTITRTATLALTDAGTNLVFYGVALEQSRIWLGTARGLGYLDGDDPSTFRMLGTEDRIISPECDENAILVEPGRVWLGTPAGLVSHDPMPLPRHPDLRAPLLLSARSGGRLLDLLEPVPELAREFNELEVRFMVPNYQVKDTISYAAKLSGVDSDWVRLETPHLRYAGIPAGPHVLELRALTRQGDPGPVTRFEFRVRPAWWERWWVRTLGILGLMGLVGLAVKLRQASLERRNRELMEEVARQTSAPLAASRAKSAFLANMSHELRTPLNAILLYSELLQEDTKDPALAGLRKDAVKIQGAGRHLLSLIDDILDMSKIEAGHMRMDLRDFELGPFFEDLDATVRPLVEKNRNQFDIEAQDAPGHFHSDPTRLRQILVNLLSNSAKFTTNGHVQVRAWSEDGHLLASVQDDGIGMSSEQQAVVFDEFVQADENTTRKFGGTGLGLTLVKKFTDLLGGTIALESSPGVGTTFTLRIPPTPPQVRAAPEQDSANSAAH
ncbi:ATP-binding protein [Geothrix sp. PMB-07]|uniref:sensor histidine kinase n=1 Tax=Geothrix sp. PMB-07 TaxID=3068640 RepID=UPI0027407817|nr:ATP-binding protein [Geothrix sp. PMB-07]WLT33061.1 ATP-binding protein [Geothrix sp. PMB-07]